MSTSYQYSSTEQSQNNIYVAYQASATNKYTTRIKVQKNYFRCALALDLSAGKTKPKVCGADYIYTCEPSSSNHITGGDGTACGRHYQKCKCASGYIWHNAGDVSPDGSTVQYETNSCVTCSTYHKYSCAVSGNVTGPVGEACNGKYEECACKSGYEWVNGACQACSSACKVGSILYADMSCNSCLISGKTPIGIVSYINGSKRLAINLEHNQITWSSNYIDLPGIDNITDSTTAKADYEGKAHTQAWVDYYGGSVTNRAAGYCYNYSTLGTSKHDWYLPALGELYPSVWTNRVAVKRGLKVAGGDKLEIGQYWSSTEHGYSSAWTLLSSTSGVGSSGKQAGLYVRCAISFSINSNGTVTIN